MKDIEQIAGGMDGRGKRFGVVASRFNERIVERLLDGAVDALVRHGVRPEDLAVVRVPGAWEIPAALEELAARGGVDGLVALGCVLRGETPHFDVICAEASRGIAAVGERHRLPVGFGLLTCDTSAQAEERSGGKVGNKGREAAEAALEMASLVAALRGGTEKGTARRPQLA